jgi:hypothetical protein
MTGRAAPPGGWHAPGMEVYIVHHVHHAPHLDGRDVEHRDADGDVRYEELYDDNLFMLGVFSTRRRADERVRRARSQPGFRDEPDCFMIECYTLDQDEWPEGFATVGG